MNSPDVIGVLGGVVAALLGLAQLWKMRNERIRAREAALLGDSNKSAERTSILVTSAETAVVVLKQALDRAQQEIERKDEIIQGHERRIRTLEDEVRVLKDERRA